MDTRYHSKEKLETTPSATALPFLLPPQQLQIIPSGLEPETLRLLAIGSDQLSYETSCWPLQLLGQGFRLPFLFTYLKSAHHSQSARVIKGGLKIHCRQLRIVGECSMPVRHRSQQSPPQFFFLHFAGTRADICDLVCSPQRVRK